ncbi:MAG: hypothetical protein JWM05_242, partial [Acidimicrobiales bacterium]|nr:hypothetical protein [Acidimicrobiales bacterium]
VRAERRLTALDEGQAWRHGDGRLLVARAEVFDDPAEGAHRATWQADAAACLAAAWRARWDERDVTWGWIEARAHVEDEATDGPAAQPVDPRVDWFEVEDHTDPAGQGGVTVYDHLTIWCGRMHIVLTGRHPFGVPIDALGWIAADVADRAMARLPT